MTGFAKTTDDSGNSRISVFQKLEWMLCRITPKLKRKKKKTLKGRSILFKLNENSDQNILFFFSHMCLSQSLVGNSSNLSTLL